MAALLAGLCLSALAAHAQNAIWDPGTTSDWNTATNWTPIPPGTPTPPGSTGTAEFGTPGVKLLTFSQDTSVGTLQFNAAAPSYTFELSHSLTITGGGIQGATPANAPMFNSSAPGIGFHAMSTAGPAIFHFFGLAPMDFFDMSNAGHATIFAGVAGNNDDFSGGFVLFHNTSTAGNATITSFVGSNIEFHDASTAGNATIPAGAGDNGFIFFNDTSSADHAKITVNPGGELDFSLFSGPFVGGTSTAGNATITNNGTTAFFQGGNGGNATITTNDGGITSFFGKSTGGNAAFITNAGGIVDISGLGTFPDNGQPPVNVPGMTAGSIAGEGTYKLGSKELTVGSNNMDTTVSGLIEDGGQAGGSGGSLIKVGTGTLTLLGHNNYSGGTTIEAGVLEVGTLTSAPQEVSFALGTGNVFLDPGTLRTTSSSTGKPMIINVGGNYTQAAGGTLALGVGGLDGSQYDHVQVAGSASLNGTLAVSSLNNFRPSNGNAFEVLRTNGTRSGEFAQVNDFLNNNPTLQRIDVYAPNGVALVYVAAGPAPTPTPPPVPTPSPTPNPRPPIIDVIPTPLPPINPEEPLPLPELLSILDPTARQLTSLFEISFSGANTQRFNLEDRLAEIQRGSTGFVSKLPPAPPTYEGKRSLVNEKSVVEKQPILQPAPENRWGVWVNGWGNFVSVDNDNFRKGYDFTTGGVTVGVDYRITEHLAIGLAGSYAHTWTHLQPAGDVDVNTGRGGLYATYFDCGFYVNGAVFGGYNSYGTGRQGLLAPANGSTDGYEFSTFLEAGYDFHFGNFTVGPVGSVQYINVHINGFNEQGSLLPLQIHTDSEESWRTDLGVQASYTLHCGSVLLVPTIRAAWEHEFKYSALPITVSSVAFPGVAATLFGPSEGHDSAIINAGLGVQWTPRISTYVGYQGQLGRDHYDSNGVTGSVSFSF
jgi:outer membrane autotransporter protein